MYFSVHADHVQDVLYTPGVDHQLAGDQNLNKNRILTYNIKLSVLLIVPAIPSQKLSNNGCSSSRSSSRLVFSIRS